MERDTRSSHFPIGSKLPSFSLPNVDGRTITDAYVKSGALGLVIFACNHCPYVIGSERMIIETVKEFEPKGLRTVVISSNDAGQYPEDSFEKMKEKAKTMSLPYPYLYDETQQIAKAFDAECTPESYLFDSSGVLIYHGAVNNSPRDPKSQSANFLGNAISQALGGEKIDPTFVHPIGCSIKWKMK